MEVDPVASSSLLQRMGSESGEIVEEEEGSLFKRLGLGLQERLGDEMVSVPRPRRRLKKRGKKKKT
jgi:hypothetical protein